MNRPSHVFLLWTCLAGQALVSHGAQFKFPTQTITVPDGFEVQLVAGPPLVDRPITADFDETGRLYVTDSSGSNDKVDKQLQDKPHRVVRLEDTDGDGRFEKSSVFADKLMFPEGCLWFQGSLYVAAPPSIWKLTDTDGDGVVDQRAEWFQGKTLTGCANDLHGPSLGLDGWIYWCKGAFATQTYPRPGLAPFTTKAAHIFRSRPDGSGIEPVLTGGMDNPVSVAFTPGGERILTGTFFVHPGGGQRDGLIHAIYGGVYGKDHDVLNGHKRTGDLMPIMTHHGPSASAFVMRYQSGSFGSEYRDNLFACLFNLHKVTRHVLHPDGATFKTVDEDFLVSDNPDFHPTALLEDADGSMLVVDTGGWYKICCPTSQLSKPDVLGAIYRVRRTAAPTLNDPRGLKMDWNNASAENLAALLDDPRMAVRERAIQQLARESAVPVLERLLQTGTTAEARRNAVWTLTRIDGAAARSAVRLALRDSDESVRSVALHSVSLHRDGTATTELISCLKSGPPHLQRIAAEALGRIGDPAAVPALFGVAATKQDRVLEHSLIYALIEIGNPAAVHQVLDQTNVSSYARRAGLIALDQMTDGGLKPEVVTPLLGSSDLVLKQTASWIVAHHPEWAKALAGFFREGLASRTMASDARTELERQLADFSGDDEVQNLMAQILHDPAATPEADLTVLRAMARAHLKQTPATWADALTEALRSPNAALSAAAASTARALALPREAPPELTRELRSLGQDATRPAEVRLDALAAMPGGLSGVEPGTFEFLSARLASTEPVMVRSVAAAVLAKARLDSAQLGALAELLKSTGPLEVPKLLSAFDKTTDESLGLKLVAALKQSPGLSGLRPDTLKARLTNFPSTVQLASEELIASLNADAPKQRAHLDELMSSLKSGDIRRGQIVFNSQKAACSSCHAIGYLGGNVGPDLTRIGQVRTERDLLEAIVYPSASFVRSFEPLLITTKDGDDFNGVVRKDAPDELVLATGPGVEVRIARSNIAEMRPGTVSVMPGGLDEQLSRQELADLISFLRATRW